MQSFNRFLDRPISPEHIEIQIEHAPHPERPVAVVFEILSGLGVHEHREPAAVEHQPSHDPVELIRRECDLVHRLGMRPDRLVAPAAELHREVGIERLAHRGGVGAARFVIVDMGVIASDFGHVFHRLPLHMLRTAPPVS